MVKREEIVRIILEESQRMTKTPNGIMAHDVHVDRIADRLVKNCDLADVGGSLISDVHVDYFENIECEIDGETKDMHEYRILVEPDSKQHSIMEKMFGEQ